MALWLLSNQPGHGTGFGEVSGLWLRIWMGIWIPVCSGLAALMD